LLLGEWGLIASSLGIELSILRSEMDFQDSELSFDSDLVKSFFLGLIFINNGNSLENVQLMEAKDLVSQDFGDLAS